MTRSIRLLSEMFCLLAFTAVALAQTNGHEKVQISGAVRDQTGAAIANALVVLRAGKFDDRTSTDQQGQFSFAGVPASSGEIQVKAAGFADLDQPWSSRNSWTVNLALTLVPARVSQRVVVSASRTEMRLGEAPGSTVVLGSTDIAATPALTLDDVLRQVPGFSLYRRSDSRTANPTSQGVSLRGLGASGPSRALVLEDGTPINDPFGGWVYWDRVPRAALADVEVFRGGASDLYGSNALGGVIQFLTRQPEAPAFTLETSYGSEKTPNLSFWTGSKIGRWDFFTSADMSRSDGYIIIPLSLRGSVDTPANAEHGTLEFGVGHQIGEGRIFLRGNLFDEARDNGTPLQMNDTHIASGVAGVEERFDPNDSLSAHLFADVQSYDQSFSSVAPDRNSETLTDLQHVPSQDVGGDIQWTHVAGHGQTLVAGTHVQEVMGASDEQLISANAYSVSGGRQRTLAFFGEDIFRIHQKWTIIAGARVDHWQNFNGSTFRFPFASPTNPTVQLFPERTETAFSPRLSVLRQLTNNLSFTASAYRAFRAPTLNELYRSFRLGNIVTNDNPALAAEHLTGAEAGLNASAFAHKLQLRGTFFWSDIVDPVSNVTLSTTPTLITRQRQNLGRTRSRGIELEGDVHLSPHIEFGAGYNYIGATVVSFPADTSLVGLEIPQVPHNQFTWSARYWNPSKIMFSVQGRYTGVQYDDDQNQFPLDGYYEMDVMAGRALGHGVQIFSMAENVTDNRYQVARTPIVNIGPPLLLSIGLRYDLPSGR